MVTRTRIPANWITQLSAVQGSSTSGTPTTSLTTQYTGNPLALATTNTPHLGPVTTVNWPLPAITSAGSAYEPSATSYGNYLILVGGLNQVGGTTWLPNVFTVYADSSGNASPAVPQPSLPVGLANAMIGVSADPSSGDLTLIVAGGNTGLTNPISSVFTASFDATAGTVSAWSQQASLPTGLYYSGMATYNGYVYLVGGTTNNSGGTTATVNFAQVQNGQILSWSTTTPLPAASLSTSIPLVTALDGMLFCDYWDLNGTRRTMYAAIHADGTIGSWQQLPTSPDNTSFAFSNNLLTTGPYGVFINFVDKIATMGWGTNGPDVQWTTFTAPSNPYTGGNWQLMVPGNAGRWQLYEFGVPPSGTPTYFTAPISLTPRISVPLPTTGLSNGATYHVVIQQAAADLNNYLRLSVDFNAFPGNPTYLYSNAGNWIWSAFNPGYAIPIQVFDKSATGKVWHLSEDSGARISTLVWGTTPNQPLLGLLEATAQPGPVLNMNPTFTAGTAPWGGNNGALAQSSAFTHGNLPFSAKFTPNGTSTQGYIESELVTVSVQQPYTANCWFYSPTGYTNCEILINWYTSAGFSGGFISSATGATTNVAANTWTQLTVTGEPPVTAVYGTIGVYERGTPPATAIFYASAATLQSTSGPMVSTVTQYTYSAAWPSPGRQTNIPTGITTLA